MDPNLKFCRNVMFNVRFAKAVKITLFNVHKVMKEINILPVYVEKATMIIIALILTVKNVLLCAKAGITNNIFIILFLFLIF